MAQRAGDVEIAALELGAVREELLEEGVELVRDLRTWGSPRTAAVRASSELAGTRGAVNACRRIACGSSSELSHE